MMNGRRIEPEILDELAAADPRAIQGRRDLRRLNWWMRHASIVDERLGLSQQAFVPRRILDLGGGDGWSSYQLVSRLPKTNETREWVLVDRHPCVSRGVVGALESAGWKVRIVEDDVFRWLERAGEKERFDWCHMNLFLHHFRDSQITDLFAGLQACTRSILACEPRRSRFALMAAMGIRLIGCSALTRHDAEISVKAGFRENEISRLWPTKLGWTVQERAAGWFSHFFWARELNL